MVVAGRHTEVSTGAFVETARRTVPRVINSCGHISSLPQTALEAAKTNRVGVLPRCNSQNAAEQPQQAKRSEAGLTREGPKSGAAGIARASRFSRFDGVFDPAAKPVNQHAFDGAERNVASEATGARAIALPERVCWSRKKGDVAGHRTARRAARPAENSCGANGEDEAAIEFGITCGHGAPPGSVRAGNRFPARRGPPTRYA